MDTGFNTGYNSGGCHHNVDSLNVDSHNVDSIARGTTIKVYIYDSVSDRGWKIGAQKGYFGCFR